MKITIDRATVEQALEAICSAKLCEFNSMSSRREMVRLMDEAITALRAALAQQAEPAPMPPFPPVSQWNQGCAVCGIGADGKAYGYVCPRHDCPTKVTCGGAVWPT